MSLRRLHPEQPDSFAFTPANIEWAQAQISKYPEGRQASAVIPLLWRAQEQEGWVSKPAIETVAEMLGMADIRVLEVASFYFMFQLKPVGTVAHVQVCGTTSCMICGAEDLIGVCKDKIAKQAHALSADGRFSWEEVECLGACANAPMVQIGKDFYEDLTEESFRGILDAFDRGEVPTPGPQNGRFAAEPLSGLTSLQDMKTGKNAHNASAALAVDLNDTVKRIDGTEVPILTPWVSGGAKTAAKKPAAKKPAAKKPAAKKATAKKAPVKVASKPAAKKAVAKPAPKKAPAKKASGGKPKLFTKPPKQIDDLKLISGVGPKLENTLHEVGVYQFAQVASWTKADIAFVDDKLSFKGRIERDNWVKQAKKLMKIS